MAVEMPSSADVVVIGAGILGAASAYNLAEAGLRVVVIDRSDFCGEASGANFGLMIASQRSPDILARLSLRSGELYPVLSGRLGRDIRYEPTGVIRAASTEEELAEVREWFDLQRSVGLDAKFCTGEELRALEPTIPEAVVGGGYSPGGGFVYPFSVVAGYLGRARELGTILLRMTEARGITVRAGRVVSVETSRGAIQTEFVVNAAGAWAGDISRLVQLDTPIVPVRGQILVTEPTDGFPHRVIVGLFPSLGRTWAGNGLVGSIQEDAGYRKEVTLDVIRRFAGGVVDQYPHLQNIQVIRAWAGLRPKTPDGIPYIGESGKVKGFVLAAGAFNIGMILGPAIGEVVRDVVLGKRPSIDIQSADPERFAVA